MTTFMEKLAAGEMSAEAAKWFTQQRGYPAPKQVSDFHIESLTPEDRASVPPLPGVNGVSAADANAWWRNKHKELDDRIDNDFGDTPEAAEWVKNRIKHFEQGEYNREAFERAAEAGVKAGQKDAEGKYGFKAGMRAGYESPHALVRGGMGRAREFWGTKNPYLAYLGSIPYHVTNPFSYIGDMRDMWLARHYVDKDFVRQMNSRELPDDPIERIRQLAYKETAASRINPEASALRRQEHGAAHLEGSFHNGLYGWAVNPVLKRLRGSWKHNDMTDLLTGMDTNEHATAYRMAATEDFGEEVARRAEQWLRVGGLGAYAAGAAIPIIATWGASAPATGGSAVSAAGTAGTAARGSAAASTVKTILGFSQKEKFIPAVTSALRTYRTTQPIAEGMRQTANMFDEGGLTTDPERARISQILNGGSDFVAAMPAYRVIDGALVTGLGWAGRGANATGLTAKLAPLAKLPGVPTAVHAVEWAAKPTAFRGRMLLGSMEAAGKFALRQSVAEAYSALEEGFEDDIIALANGKRPDEPFWMRYQGVRTKWLGRPIADGLLNKYDSTAAMHNAGKGLAVQQASIDEIMSDPESVAMMKQKFGMPDATDEELRNVMPMFMAVNRYTTSYGAALDELDSGFDWDNCTPEEYEAKWKSFTPEQRSEALYKAFRNDAACGGYIAPATFSDPNLTQEQKRKLLSLYIQSEDNASGGTLVGQMFRGEKQVAVDAMQKSPQVREACVAYASGIVADALTDPTKLTDVGSGEVATAVLNEMTKDELKQVMEPLLSATPDQVIALQKSLQANADSAVAQAGKDMIMKRLQYDGNFAAQFIPKFTAAIKDGQGISQHDMDKMLKIVDDGGVDAMFGTMDDDNFFRFARWAMSDEGSGMLDDMSGERGLEIKGLFEQAAKERMWDAVKRNPLKNLPIATSLWFKSQGWEGMGDFAENPGLLYGVMALLLGGAVWLGGSLFGEDDDDYIGDASDAVRVSKKQREILTKELFG